MHHHGADHVVWHTDACHLLQQSNTTGLVVISEEQDTRTLLIHEIQTEDIYQRQGGDMHCALQPLGLSCHMSQAHHVPTDMQTRLSSPGQTKKYRLMWRSASRQKKAVTPYGENLQVMHQEPQSR